MGVVYLAEQSAPVQRQVALKLLKAGTDSEQVLVRFEAERQALAVMDHPSIAKIYDAGVTEGGEPFFAMEVVKGLELAEYCDERRLTTRQRVELLVDVCHAVQHAHQKGLIHRDLKPSNVLVSEVDGRPLPRVIDFGIAKAAQGATFSGPSVTTDDQVIGTPAYMSPEQIEGAGDVDTRTDVYALGVLLFEILVGALPYDREAYRGWAAIAAQLHREVPTPAERFAELADTHQSISELRSTSPGQLRRELAGDLGWIVARAMERDRDSRYETVNALAVDLQRYLAHEPVRARGASTAYVLRKFARRHRVGVSFAGTVAVGLVGLTVVLSIQADRIARARDEAQTRRGQAEGLIDFMLSDLREKLEPIGQLEILDDVGDQATAYFAAIPEDQFSDTELASRSQALYQVGSVRLSQGDSEGAVGAFAESLRLARALSERAPEDVDRLFGLSQSHFYVGYASYLEDDLEAAETEFLGYLGAAERLVAHDPANLDYRMELGYAHSNLGSVLEARGDFAGAVEAYSRTLEVKEHLVAQDSTNIGWLGELAETHNTLAVAYRRMGDYSGANSAHQAELALKQELLQRSPAEAYWRYRLGLAYTFLAQLQVMTGELPSALQNARAAFAILDSLSATDPTNLNWENQATLAGGRAGLVAAYVGLSAESEAYFGVAARRAERLSRGDVSLVARNAGLAGIRTTRARALLLLGAPAEALEEARASYALLGGSDDGGRVLLLAQLENALVRGQALAQTGDSISGQAALQGVIDRIEADRGDPGFDELRPMLAEAYLALGRLDEARTELDHLAGRGYREPYLTDLARATSAWAPPTEKE